MRAYHLLCATHALDDIRHRRLKIATFDDLNDPFELWSIAQPTRIDRDWMRRSKKQMAREYGLLCFSRSWHSPALWGHYGDKHKGIALGFDVRRECAKDVSYVATRVPARVLDEATAQMFLFTKHLDWRYEQECRIFTRLEDRDPASGFYFAPFGGGLTLREVIAGPLCTVPKAAIVAALATAGIDAAVIKARLAFNSFRVVTNRRGFRPG